jgi:hypothetical protein
MSISQKASRKFLHAMIGDLLFAIPFFTSNIYPVLVAAPFILITLLASSYSPFKDISRRSKGLADITEEGHPLGLAFYAVCARDDVYVCATKLRQYLLSLNTYDYL